MFSIRKTAANGLLWLTFAAIGFASPVATNLNVTQWSYPILTGGQFQASLNGAPAISVICVDWQNLISKYNYEFPAYLSDSTDLSVTRYGTTAASGFSYAAGTYTALDRYTMAAWLTTQFTYPTSGGNPAPTQDDMGIQNAIWTLLTQTGASPGVRPDQPTLDKWLNAAAAFKTAGGAAYSSIQQNMRIITTTDVATANDRYHSGQQEYMFVTPEPGSYLLLGSGLLLMGLLRKRRG